MIKNLFRSSVFIFFIFISSALIGEVGKNSKLIDIISKDKIQYGCGCSYSMESNNSEEFQPIFQSELGFSNAVMYINGKLVPLKPIKTYDLESSRPSVGDKFTLEFKYNDFLIEFNNTITFVCPPKSEGCEVTRFKADLTVSNGKTKEFYSVKGDCGC